ncbi:MAG: DNA-directed RNA polymerase [Planctomycetota bacterium]
MLTEKEVEAEARTRGIERVRKRLDNAKKRGGGGALLSSAGQIVDRWYAPFRKAIEAAQQQRGRRLRIEDAVIRKADTEVLIGGTFSEVLGACLLKRETEDPEDEEEDEVSDGAGPVKVAERLGKAVCRAIGRKKPKPLEPFHVGARLIGLLLDVDAASGFPALIHERVFSKKRAPRGKGARKTPYRLRFAPWALRAIDEGTDRTAEYVGSLLPQYPPMVRPPQRWTAQRTGGYFEGLRTPRFAGRGERRPPRVNEAVREAVNVLDATPWRINRRILGVLKADGVKLRDEAKGLYARLDELPRSLKKREEMLAQQGQIGGQADPRFMELLYAAGERAKIFSRLRWIRELPFKLKIAERFADEPSIWFPHRIDFRGRAYPIPELLNHHGDDVCRGLLEFAEGKELTEKGRKWLKIHLANRCGHDKESFDERLKWVQEHDGEIKGWAADPLKNTCWRDVEDPYQALAAAIALNDEEAAKHLPVHVDASNSGWQQYAAMLRDADAGRETNLVPAESPADLYGMVGRLLARAKERTFKTGPGQPGAGNVWVNLLPDGPPIPMECFDRRNLKSVIMTLAYGATEWRRRGKLRGKLRDLIGYVDIYEDEDGKLYRVFGASDAAILKEVVEQLSKELRAELGKSFPRVLEAWDWLQDCGKRIAGKGQETVRWTTPLGMEVEQPYRDERTKRQRTKLGRVSVNVWSENCPIDDKKQARAFAPNFVHSIDAAHMMRTAQACGKAGIHFAAVHDCFWTHAENMDGMRDILREEFVRVHEEPLLEALWRQMRKRYPSVVRIDRPPALGDLDIRSVLGSPYCFS